MTLVEREPEEHVLKSIQDAYLRREMRKTRECIEGMARSGLYEADVEKVFMDAEVAAKGRPAEAADGGGFNHAQYVIYGKSTNGVPVCCMFSSKHHPKTDDFIHWVITSFEQVGISI